ncbi:MULTISPECIES: DUF3107 domain-containing protein [unclassified Rothia (in: high G+C Gram-positive bacteria)]|uniref:DUF3107 domain-containing protein n=1 Tax=unclassified Rothia (in: high G+C Gram-positive bacteria) TaxID=2689056 RepID=UPI001956949E|nr:MULTISPECIES: DUF3107 domain-containing protein [unclassified Rothia (in: high G+C Gram-positive bacteria)]MBM7051086.1 DUF3107 domain-containing protein [Rothia sp. ZJ1223]QRZ62214.1 DUF3107 domain-containing protein [Rothia sp. ZJ932]
MDIKIGVQNVQREIVVDTDESADAVKAKVAESLANGSVLELTDSKGTIILVPGAQLGYVEIGAETKRRIGFGFSEA